MDDYWFKTDYDDFGEVESFTLIANGRPKAVVYPVEIGGGREGVSAIICGREFAGDGLEDIADGVIGELKHWNII